MTESLNIKLLWTKNGNFSWGSNGDEQSEAAVLRAFKHQNFAIEKMEEKDWKSAKKN